MKHPNDHEPGTPVEGLDALWADREPPPALENDLVDALFTAGASAGRSADDATAANTAGRNPHAGRSPSWSARPLLQMAAAIALVAGGWIAGRSTAAPTGLEGRYMMLLWEDARFEPAAPESVASEYATWAREVAGRGVAITGRELAPERSYAGDPADASGEDAGSALLGGYFIVDTADPQTVQALAETHPHVRHGGWVEVAPIVVR